MYNGIITPLRAALRAGKACSMSSKVTIYDIAREAGVSTATVTRVVRGDANVKAATREKVQRVIDAYAYVPSDSARHLDGGSARTIALVMPHVANPYFARIYSAAYEECRANGYTLFLYQVKEHKPITRDLVDEIIRRRFDGAVFAGGIWSSERSGLSEALSMLKHHMPTVAICPASTELDCICINNDLVAGIRLPVRHLHALGHRRIAYIGGSMQTNDPSRRGENFLLEMQALGLPDDPGYHIDAGYDSEGGERAVLRMLSALDKRRWPTAMVAFNDLVALGAIKQLRRMGLHLPDDMAVVGFDNQFFCPYLDPALTSVDTHPEEQAQSAIRELLSTRNRNASAFSIVQDATLVVRESCGAKLGFRKLD